jgi:hypothetical protein
MINHNHSFLRFLIDTLLVLLLIFTLISPIFFILSLKINDLNLQAKVTEVVAGVNTKK